MKFSAISTDKYPTVVRHQGMSIVLALRQEDEVCNIYYRVLATDPAQPDDDKCWSDYRKLVFPTQLRPAGMSLVTVDLKTDDAPFRALSTAEQTADAPFQALSDGKHVYLFRQSTGGTLYVDRFVFDPVEKSLNPNWEPRFQRSRKRDIPASRKDSLGARDMEGEPFIEPTMELSMIQNLEDGRFSVLLLPGRLPSEWRWQIFVTNSKGEIDSFSIRRSEDGLFDVKEKEVQQTCFKWAASERRFLTGPAALLYMQQEEAQDEYGRTQRLKRGARVMLAAPVGSSRYALELDGADDYVSLGNPNSLQIEGAITIEAWVKVQATDGRRDIVAHGAGGVSLRIQDGQYQIGVGDQCVSYDIPQEDVGTWIHLAGAYDDGKQKAWLLYRNGNKVSQKSDPTGAATVEEDWAIGKSFAGQINNVRLWNLSRAQADIEQNMHRPLAGNEPGLVGYWPFDEGMGDAVHDQVRGNHGQLYVGWALELDGVDDYVEIPALDLSKSETMTIEAWIKPGDISTNRHYEIIRQEDVDWQPDWLLAFQEHGQILSFGLLTGGSYQELDVPIRPTDYTDGQWHHIAATYDGQTQRLYKDGREIGSQPRNGQIGFHANAVHSIGSWKGKGLFFKGQIGHVRFWNVARTKEEIQDSYDRLTGDEAGLLRYWPLDEGAGVTIHDQAGDHHGQLNVGYGNALDFDGVDDYVSIPAINLNAYNTMSIEAWVKPGDISTNPYYEIIRQEGVEWPDWLLAFQEHGQILSFGLFTDGSYQELDVDITPTDYTDGQWHHIAATYDGQTQRLYRDGDEIGRKSKTGHIRFSADAVHAIGACRGKSEFFEGQIGQVCLWNVARTPEDIRQDKSNYLTGDESGLAACWSLDEGTGDRIQDSASKNHGQFHAGSGGNLEPKWVKGPLPADVGTKWVACDNPHEKWVARAPIAVLDYGLSRQGTLAMLPDQSVVSLGLKGDDGPVDLSVPRFQAEADQMAKPMGVVHRDKQGLSVCAGLLELARCGDTPYLLDGADGLIHLYFRGDQSQFLVAQYDTLTARAEYALPLGASDGGPQLRFIARQPGSHMNDYTIKIEEATEQTCRVTLNGPDGVNETWQNVPRELEQFLAVLNGTATADANDPLVEKRKLVLYDYNNKQNVQRQGVPDLTSGDIPFFGSTLFGVGVDNLPEPGQALQVQSGKVTQAQPSGKDCAWVSEKQGKALKFDGDNDYVRLPPHLLDIPGDLTMEAWVKVAPGDHNNMRLVNYHTQELRFTLGLNRAEKGEGYQVVAGNGDKAIQAVGALVPPDEWTHLAAVYDATTALKLDGQGYVDCGNDVTLDMGEAMTIEAWVTPAMPTGQRQPEVILSKWGSNPAEQSWRLYIDPDGKPCFETQNDNNKLTSVKADLPLEAGQAYHLAAIFDATSEKVCALDLTGKSPDLVRIANSDRLQIEGAITIEAWIKVNAENIDELKNRDIQNIVARDHDPDGKEAVFLRTFQGKYQIGSWKGDGTGDRLAEFAIPQEDINTWVHLAGVYDDQEQAWVLYRNGVEVNRKPATVGALSAIYVPWTIGAAGWGNFPRTFKGQINNVRLWDCALSVEDIVKNMDKPATEIEGAVGNWEVDQADYSSKSRVSNKCDQTGEIAKRTDGTLEGAARIVKDLPKSNYRQKILVGQGGAQETQESWLKVPEKELNPTNTKVNLGRSASEEDYFRGIIDEVRLWQVNRYDGQIHYYRDRPPGNAEGLVSNWRFEEGRGKTASDVKGSNHGRLVHPEAEQIPAMWISSARNARFILYVNGQVATGEEIKLADHGHYGLNNRFTIGAMIDEDETVQPEADKPLQNMAGCIDEVRLWDTVRTPEQLRDNMYRALFGGEEGLVGYWPLDEGEKTTVYDQTGNGQHGTVKEEQWIDSTAPIGNEGPEVKNVYGGQPKPGFNRRIIGPPAAVEYGDMQWDAEGNLFGVMKRGYIFQEEAIQLVTGFKVGDLELHFIGQVQTAPTLIGYIEGAPPVPSENLTVNDPEEDDYVGTSSIQLTEAKETIQLYSASRDLGLDFSWDFKRGFYWAANVEVEYSFVTGSVGGDVFSTEGKVGTHSYFESSAAQLSGATITAGTSKTLTKSLALCGGWEEPQDYDQTGQTRYLNPEVGQRYLPNNMGYALVKSATADLFALRLKSTGSLVAFQVVPNPDIPEDWNIIMFPLNPKYVKNGTLDGMVGLVPDPDYPGAIAGERGSYFKPLEAYALKERIERDAEKLESYYANFTPAAKLLSSGEGRLLDELPETTLGYDWQTGRDRRSMVNTYVWTADGGFYAEEEQFSSIRQESLGGSYHYLEREGVFTDITLAAAGVGFCLEEDALFGSHLNVTVGKSKEDKAAFGLQVEVQGEGYLFEKGEWNEKTQKFNYTSHACPGKVDGYRFMTFYLAPRSNNFDEFFEDVVDPEWLKGQGKYGGDYSPNARALREAQARPNEVWRVLHRVTYVSRIPPQFERAPAEVVPKDVHRPDNIEANGGLIQEIEQLAPPQPSLIELGVAVDKLLGQPPVSGDDGWSPGELEGIIPWWTKVKSEAKKEIRRDVIEYLKGYYEIDPARSADSGEIGPDTPQPKRPPASPSNGPEPDRPPKGQPKPEQPAPGQPKRKQPKKERPEKERPKKGR